MEALLDLTGELGPPDSLVTEPAGSWRATRRLPAVQRSGTAVPALDFPALAVPTGVAVAVLRLSPGL